MADDVLHIGERLATLDTPALSDALDRLGIDGQVVGILPLDRSFELVGRAFTVRMLPRGLSGRDSIAGTVIDGVCRDVGRALELGYPIYSRSNTMRTGKDRVAAEAYNEPVQLAGVRVEPGDWLRGDGDGVVVIPHQAIDDVLAAAEEIAAVEERIRDRVAGGAKLDEIRNHLNYHELQTRRTDE